MTNATLVKITRYVSLLGCGMLAGVAVTVLVLELALRRLNGREYASVRQAEFASFTLFVGALLLPTLVAVAMLVIHARKAHSITLRPAVIALALLLLALLVSLAVNGPINVQQLSWNVQAPPADWARIRDRWQIAHAVRTLAIVLAFGHLSVAILDRPVPGMPDRSNKADR
jgi:quinol-cytochrome oxidoreductase complex cytochrome b subunit